MPLRLTDGVILHASHLPACRAQVDKRFVGYASLQLMTGGTVELSYNDRQFELQKEMVWPCNPGPWIRFHSKNPDAPWYHHHIALRGPLLDHWRAEGLWPNEPQAAPDGDEFVATFRHMVAHAQAPTEHLLALNLLERVLLLLAQARRSPLHGDWVDRAKAMLSDPQAFHSDVDQVADDCGMPTSTFRRRFSAAVGMSPREFSLAHRLQRARDLLLDRQLSIAEVAERLGYRDVFFFSKQFRQHTGMPPTAFRASHW
jgi:AraC-like DNA-binding protein